MFDQCTSSRCYAALALHCITPACHAPNHLPLQGGPKQKALPAAYYMHVADMEQPEEAGGPSPSGGGTGVGPSGGAGFNFGGGGGGAGGGRGGAGRGGARGGRFQREGGRFGPQGQGQMGPGRGGPGMGMQQMGPRPMGMRPMMGMPGEPCYMFIPLSLHGVCLAVPCTSASTCMALLFPCMVTLPGRLTYMHATHHMQACPSWGAP